MFNRQLSIKTVIAAIALWGLGACSKDSSENKDQTISLITRVTWKFSKATANGLDVSSLIQACSKDNQVTFTSGTPANTGVFNEGATKCNATDPQTINFTWQYDATLKKITITGVSGTVPILPGGSNEFTLVSISNSQLVMSQNVSFSGTTQLVEVTLVP